jgi:hypothetical protein
MWIENYQCEECEVLEASIEMRLFLELHNNLKVRVVYVRIHPEEALEDRLDNIAEVRRKRSPYGIRNWDQNTRSETRTSQIKLQFQVFYFATN